MAPTVLITGASQGIGRETAHLFAEKGYNVVLAARDLAKLEAVAAEVRQKGCLALAVATDVRDPQQVQHLVEVALTEYPSLEVLVNNAGRYCSGPVESFSLEDWHQVLDLNLWGYIHLINALLPHFLAQGSGTIVNLCSIGGKVPIPYLAPYNTSKFAIAGLTESLHAELQPKGIHVCGIYPSLVHTSLMERAMFRGHDASEAEGRRKQLENVLKTPIPTSPEQVAQAVWEAVSQQKSEILVGSAQVSHTLYQFLPKAMQWLFRQGFKEGQLPGSQWGTESK